MSIFRDNALEKEKVMEEFREKYEREAIQQIIKRFEKDCDDKKKMIKPFSDIAKNILGDDTYIEFMDKTGLAKDMFYDLKKRNASNAPFYKKTIISVCVGYNVGIEIALDLLRSQGSFLNPHRDTDTAYVVLLTEYRGKTIDECNELLEQLGVPKADRLGKYAQKPKKNRK